MKEILARLTAGEELSKQEVETAVNCLFSEDITDSEISAFLISLKSKGETVGEIAALVDGIRSNALSFKKEHSECYG